MCARIVGLSISAVTGRQDSARESEIITKPQPAQTPAAEEYTQIEEDSAAQDEYEDDYEEDDEEERAKMREKVAKLIDKRRYCLTALYDIAGGADIAVTDAYTSETRLIEIKPKSNRWLYPTSNLK